MAMISIIIPALDEAANLPATLAVLQSLRRQGHEIVLVDGGSRDASVAVARPLVDRVLVVAPGRAAQMNAGAAIARGELLWFLHADTRATPQALTQLRDAAQARHAWGRFDVRLSGALRSLRLVEWTMNHRSRLTAVATGDQGMFVRREVFDAVGGFPDLPLMEDIALSKRLRRLAPPACLPGPLVSSSRRWERGGVWRTIVLMWRLRLAYFLGADPHRLHRRYYGRRP